MAAFVIRDARGRSILRRASGWRPIFISSRRCTVRTARPSACRPARSPSAVLVGPESIPENRTLTVGNATCNLQLPRCALDRSFQLGWWSGDHHIHAAGCAHYTNPTEGVLPKDMLRHFEGEDLKVGCNLTWGPCFDYQKQFFTGALDKVSQYPYLLRYDIEVSGFGSHQSGHLCLLRLKGADSPGRHLKGPLAHALPQHTALGEEAGRRLRPRALANGLAARSPESQRRTGRTIAHLCVPPFDGIGAKETSST